MPIPSIPRSPARAKRKYRTAHSASSGLIMCGTTTPADYGRVPDFGGRPETHVGIDQNDAFLLDHGQRWGGILPHLKSR